MKRLWSSWLLSSFPTTGEPTGVARRTPAVLQLWNLCCHFCAIPRSWICATHVIFFSPSSAGGIVSGFPCLCFPLVFVWLRFDQQAIMSKRLNTTWSLGFLPSLTCRFCQLSHSRPCLASVGRVWLQKKCWPESCLQLTRLLFQWAQTWILLRAVLGRTTAKVKMML